MNQSIQPSYKKTVSRLKDAIEQDNAEDVKTILENGLNVNTILENGVFIFINWIKYFHYVSSRSK